MGGTIYHKNYREGPNLRIFKRRLDQYWRQYDLKYNFRRVVNCNPISNQRIVTNESDSEKEGATDDLDT